MSVTVTTEESTSNRQIITAANHAFFSDLATDSGGEGTAASPYDLLLGAWGSCTNMTLQLYARRKGWPLEKVATHLTKEQQGNRTIFRKEIQLWGALSQEQVAALDRIAEKCPVNQMMMNNKLGSQTVERKMTLVSDDLSLTS